MVLGTVENALKEDAAVLLDRSLIESLPTPDLIQIVSATCCVRWDCSAGCYGSV
jgi:hypothetical protein